MSHRRTRAPASSKGYIELDNQDDDDPRPSTNSNSPILPKPEPEGIDEATAGTFTTFDTNGLERHYRPIDAYEGAHRYDPDYTWNQGEERKVVRKVNMLFNALPNLSSNTDVRLD